MGRRALGRDVDATSPATGEEIGEVQQGGREDARRAIAAANARRRRLGAADPFDRAAALERVADEVEKRRETLARTLTLDQGKPLAESRDEVEELSSTGGTPPRTGSGSRAGSRTRCRRASASSSCAGRAASSA